MRYTLFTLSLMAVFSGCATSEPGREELHKGAYRPVRAPTFQPHEDAPHTFHPGKPSPVQPGPRPARVLPETPETRKGPGLWSTARPTSATLAPPEVEGIVLPFPPGTSTPEDEVPTRWCAFSLAKVAQEDASLISLTKISSKNVRRCLVATAYAHCAYIETSRREKGLRATTPQETERFRRARDASAAWRAEMCGKAPPSDDDARRLGHLLSGWNRRNP